MAVPHIFPESQVNIFKFYNNDAIHEAVMVRGKIMKLAGVFAAHQKREAFNFAYELCQKYFTSMTPSSSFYRVWVDVRCPSNFDLGVPLGVKATSLPQQQNRHPDFGLSSSPLPDVQSGAIVPPAAELSTPPCP